MVIVHTLAILIAIWPLGQSEEVALAGGGSEPVERLEADGLAVAMLPGLGGKLISLRGPDGYEWLSRSDRPYRARAGLASFGDGEFDGADEIFPTMDACDDLPAHGEAWRLAWKRCDGPGLSYVLVGGLRPYRLQRTITIEPGAIQLSYALENRGYSDLRYTYLFHPLFSIIEPLRMELPAAQQVVVTNAQHHFLATTGSPVPWSTLVDGPFASATATVVAKRFWSLAVSPAPAFVRLRRPGGASLTMTWDVATLPHLAVWGCEASPFVGNLAHFAPEPASGPTSTLSAAIADGSAATLPAGSIRRWSIRLSFAP